MNEELIAEAAGNLASWHDSSLRALDVECERDGLTWQANTAGPEVYFRTITLTGPDEADDHYRRIQELVEAHGDETLTVCDSWGALDLAPLGFDVLRRGSWMVRHPAPPQRSPFPADFAIERVITEKQLAAWEAASAEGFGASSQPERGTLHGAAILQDPRMQVFSGSADGQVVGGAMAYIGDRILGVYGVSVIPQYRRRRFAEMLTWRCVLARPNIPAVLQPSEPAEPLYRTMGFEPIGEYVAWIRPAGR
ncbi:MAG: GNAT family N-acetyltransferase [Dehalococcoidia bacterium]|nr:GNAT family N-acetyltransferase [Dehalococcoidia bacterium]